MPHNTKNKLGIFLINQLIIGVLSNKLQELALEGIKNNIVIFLLFLKK